MNPKSPTIRSALWFLGILIGAFLLGWGLPVVLPFVVGFFAAWAAEPGARVLGRRLPRAAASGISVTVVYGALLLGLWGLWRLAVGEMNDLSAELPELLGALGKAAASGEGWLMSLVRQAPERLRPGLERNVRSLFTDTSGLMERLTASALRVAGAILGSIPDAFVFLGTAITASFLISVRLPRLRVWVRERLPQWAAERMLPTLRNLRANFGGWVRAQLKLMVLTCGILTAGFLFLRVRYPVLLGILVALVDALPILGTGTVLVPWSAAAFLQGNTALGVGLLSLYAAAALSRTFWEPRLVGRQLGLSPLLTLLAVYVGYRFWGILGMILAPISTVTLLDLWAMGKETGNGTQ